MPSRVYNSKTKEGSRDRVCAITKYTCQARLVIQPPTQHLITYVTVVTVSILSLDISGAYDHVSTERLLWILKRKGLPEWIIKYVQNFMLERRTRVAFNGYESEWIQTNSGILQGSPISPILFLFFISELLEGMQNVAEKQLGFSFIDDTNIITWSDSAQENCT